MKINFVNKDDMRLHRPEDHKDLYVLIKYEWSTQYHMRPLAECDLKTIHDKRSRVIRITE